MRLKNTSQEARTVLDTDTGKPADVAPGSVAEFSRLCAFDLLHSFPDVWTVEETEAHEAATEEGET